ncbi:hypothetical protein Aab01nite_07830 [Paractinoplanes abujensis]|uniref:DUF2332 domain-containing protein n=1 Tax=Paractinoplanes abujensis TaxID=882441 RepID=A0A7W7CMQ1_9ACTN|nr:DUF2332 domain-containing protein [Actinoplanes abujensis]MBB4691394.1 hypothetical protein [Actinoplanes abujensis]GID17193.1 hypothetical protein Aab01nite_07830 [Actinoplanes abujensis]
MTTTADWYVDFADRQARGSSPTYERLTREIARDDELLALLDTVPEPKRQPNLLLAVVRLLGGPVENHPAFRSYVVTRWAAVATELRRRATQTNEIGRSALLLPVLAELPQPLALLEVGASAGLNLYLDRYSYDYDGVRLGTSGPVLPCHLTGRTPPTALPTVTWRAGLDLNPLDITDADDRAWLEALIWPEHDHRRDRLRAAAEIAAADPPRLVRGDLVDDLPALAAEAPADATLVVFHTSVLYQVPADRRAAFIALTVTLPGHWLAAEDPEVTGHPGRPADGLHKNVLSLDGRPLAWTEGHGRSMSWF